MLQTGPLMQFADGLSQLLIKNNYKIYVLQ